MQITGLACRPKIERSAGMIILESGDLALGGRVITRLQKRCIEQGDGTSRGLMQPIFVHGDSLSFLTTRIQN